MAEINLIKEETIDAQVTDINYIPAYKVAEEERRKNELERVSNENERETYFEDMVEKFESGYFKGEKGEQGIQGIQGEKGEKGDKGDKGEPGQNGKDGKDGKDGYTQDLSNYYTKPEIDELIGDIESVLNEVV